MAFLLKFALILAISAFALGAGSPKTKCDPAACYNNCGYGYCVLNPYTQQCFCDYENDPRCRNDDNCDGEICSSQQFCTAANDGYGSCYCAYFIEKGKEENEPAAAVDDGQQ